MKEKNVIRKNVVQMVRAAILQIEKDKKIEVSDSPIVEIIANGIVQFINIFRYALSANSKK